MIRELLFICCLWPFLFCTGCLASQEEPAAAAVAVAAAATTVTVVTSPQQLKDAVVRGDAYIEVQEHLDMSTVDPVDFRMLGILPESVKAIQGNCASPVPPMDTFNLTGAPLLAAATGVCLIATDVDFLYAWKGSVWLSRLYVRLKRTERTNLPVLVHVHHSPRGELWATDCVFQGDALDNCRALYSDGAAFAQGTTIADMSRDEAAVIVRIRDNSVSLRNCTLIAAPPPGPPADPEAAATPPPAMAADPHAPAVQAQVASLVRLEAVEFRGYGNIYLLLDSQGTSHFFSDEMRRVWDIERGEERSARTLADAGDDDKFLSMDDSWLQGVQKDLQTLPRKVSPAGSSLVAVQASLRGLYDATLQALETLPLEKLPLEGLPGAELGPALQVAAAAATAAAVLVLALLLVCTCRSRRSQAKAKQA